MKFIVCLLLALVTSEVLAGVKNAADNPIVVSPNGHFLQYADGTPFFYLGDTAWELFHRLSREEADDYLNDRAHKGFTVVQAVAVAELDGIGSPNVYGHLPFVDQDPTRPDIHEGTDDDYWDHVDYIVHRANALGIVVGLLPTWGCYWHDGGQPVFNAQNAYVYGRWLGKRYRDAGVIWILGGDRNVDNDAQRATLQAMAQGLQEGDGGVHLITLHPRGGGGSAEVFHDEPWLSFNMRQNGHDNVYATYANTLRTYLRTPSKPVIDGEPIYEDHPVNFDPDRNGHSTAADVRRALYWDLFEGACGHTYGHHSVWQMYQPGKYSPVNRPLMCWREALQQPGASQMHYAKDLLLSYPFFTRIPATDEVLEAGEYSSAMPGRGTYHFAATRDTEGTYIMVYAPTGRPFTVHTDCMPGKRLRLSWFNPRTGRKHRAGLRPNTGSLTIASPAEGEMEDWVLVIEGKGSPAKSETIK